MSPLKSVGTITESILVKNALSVLFTASAMLTFSSLSLVFSHSLGLTDVYVKFFGAIRTGIFLAMVTVLSAFVSFSFLHDKNIRAIIPNTIIDFFIQFCFYAKLLQKRKWCVIQLLVIIMSFTFF